MADHWIPGTTQCTYCYGVLPDEHAGHKPGCPHTPLSEEAIRAKARAERRRAMEEVRDSAAEAALARWRRESHITTQNGLAHGCTQSAEVIRAMDLDAIEDDLDKDT